MSDIFLILASLFIFFASWLIFAFPFFITAIVSAFCCWLFIRFLGHSFAGKTREWTPERHQVTKQGIPTMGGIVLIAVWFLIWGGLIGEFMLRTGAFPGLNFVLSMLPSCIILIGMGLLGAYDDWSKINRRGGIKPWTKFIAQITCALLAVGTWYWHAGMTAQSLWVPVLHWNLPLGSLMVFWGVLVVVSASNAFNLTDGLDGLAGMVFLLTFLPIGLISLVHFGLFSINTVLPGAWIAAGCFAGFLCFNWHPARLFMGDAGALAFGALLGLYAVQLNITLLLPFIAIVPVLETLSVMLQVAWFKLYKTRIFKMAPLHHHLELNGYSEPQIVLLAAVVTVIGIVLARILVFL